MSKKQLSEENTVYLLIHPMTDVVSAPVRYGLPMFGNSHDAPPPKPAPMDLA